MTDDLAAITCFFSYAQNVHAVKRYEEFKRNLERQGVKLYTVELAFFDEDFLLEEDDTYLRLRTDTVLWHKEALLNILAKRLPPYIKKIAWLDCDIFIEDNDWLEKASLLLNKYKVIEMGSEHIYLNENGHVERTHQTTGYALHHNKKDWAVFYKYHPGLGWAARRELFTEYGGLFEYGLSGGGDGVMAYAFANGLNRDGDKDIKYWMPPWKHNFYKEGCPTFPDRVAEYRDKVAPYVSGSVSYLDSKVFHRWHAPQSRRGYKSRPSILKGVDLYKDLEKDERGVFKWKDVDYNLVFEKFFSMKDKEERLRKGISYAEVNLEKVL